MLTLFRLFAAALALLLVAAPAQAAPAIWAVRDADSTLYLFGTVHITSADTAWRTPLYDRIYQEAGEVWLELDLTDMGAMRARIAREGIDPEGRLEARIGKADFDRVLALLAPYGLDAGAVRRLQPWYAGLQVLYANIAGTSLQAETGAEVTVTAAAQADGKPMRYLETVMDQVHALSDQSEVSQVAFLREMLASGGETTAAVNEMADAWSAGDETRLTEEVIAAVKAAQPEMYDALFRRRNLAWAETLDAEMRGAGVDLVTVGAGHLLGDEGLVALLRAKGYRVERVQ